jgi:hypothetical protein
MKKLIFPMILVFGLATTAPVISQDKKNHENVKSEEKQHPRIEKPFARSKMPASTWKKRPTILAGIKQKP